MSEGKTMAKLAVIGLLEVNLKNEVIQIYMLFHARTYKNTSSCVNSLKSYHVLDTWTSLIHQDDNEQESSSSLSVTKWA